MKNLKEKVKNYNKKGKISKKQERKIKKLGQKMRREFRIGRAIERENNDRYIEELMEQRRIIREVEDDGV